MHKCPFCDFLCDCDWDDTWGLPVPDDCPHVCGVNGRDDDWEDYEEFMDFDGRANEKEWRDGLYEKIENFQKHYEEINHDKNKN